MKRHVASMLPKIQSQIMFTDHVPWGNVATWFIDPPYQSNPVSYSDIRQPMDYATLRDRVLQLRGQVIVCEQAPADWLPFRVLKSDCLGKMQKISHSELVYP